MTGSVFMAGTILAGVCATAPGIAAVRWHAARAEARANQDALRVCADQVMELRRLRSTSPAWTSQPRPAPGITPRVSAALAANGLAASSLVGVSPESEIPIGEPDLRARRARATLTLSGLTLPQVGRFLASWRSAEPQWIPASIDLSPQASAAAPAGGDIPLRTVIVLESLFVEKELSR